MVMRAFLLMGGVNLIVIKKKKTWKKKIVNLLLSSFLRLFLPEEQSFCSVTRFCKLCENYPSHAGLNIRILVS